MKNYSLDAFVLGVRPLVENDKVVVLLTKEIGKLEVVAKGLGKPLSKKSSQIDILNNINCQLYKRNSLDLLTEVKLIDDFNQLKSDMNKIAEIFFIAELAEKFSIAGEESHIYPLVQELLRHLLGQDELTCQKLMASFELHLLTESGHSPVLDVYTNSQQKLVQNEKRYAHSQDTPGYTKQFSEFSEGSDRILKAQRFFVQNGLGAATEIALDMSEIKIMRNIHNIWLEGVLGNRLKSKSFNKYT